MPHAFSFWAYAQLHLSRHRTLVGEGTNEWIRIATQWEHTVVKYPDLPFNGQPRASLG